MRKSVIALIIAAFSILWTPCVWALPHSQHTGSVCVSKIGEGTVYLSTSGNATTGDASATWSCAGDSSKDSKTFYLYAQPSAGWDFVGWSGSGTSSDTPYEATLNAQNGEQAFIATFAMRRTLSFQATENGTYSATDGTGTIAATSEAKSLSTGKEVTMTAAPAAGFTVKEWWYQEEGGSRVSLGKEKSYKHVFEADATIGVEFMVKGETIVNKTTGEKFFGLAAAVEAVSSGETLELLDDDDLAADVTLPTGVSLVVPQQKVLTVPVGKQLVNEGNLFVEGELINGGTISGGGTISTCARLFTQENKNGEWGPTAEPVYSWPSPKVVYWVTKMQSNVGKVTGVSGALQHVTFRNGRGSYVRSTPASSVPNVVVYSVDGSIAMNHVSGFLTTSSNGLDANNSIINGLKVLTGNVSYGTAEGKATKYSHDWGATDCAGNTLTVSKELGGGSVFAVLNGVASVTGKITGTDLTFVNCSKVTASSWTDSSTNYKQSFRFYDTTVVFGSSGINFSGRMKTGGDGMVFYSGKYDANLGTPSKCKVYAYTDENGKVYSGAFKNDPNSYLADNVTYVAKQRESDDYWVVQIRKQPVYVAVSDGVEYEDLSEAISKSTSGGITLKKHVELEEPVTIPAGKAITLELAGYNITGATGVFVNNGTLAINDGSHNDLPSTVSATAGNLFENNGTMEITCGTYSGAVLLNGGNFITHGGTFNVTLTAGTSVTDKSAVADLRGGKFMTASRIAETTETVEASTRYTGGFLDHGYVAVPYDGMLWVGYGTYATAKEITLNGTDKAWELTALSAADQKLYAKNPATREDCANDAKWRRFLELESMITPCSV